MATIDKRYYTPEEVAEIMRMALPKVRRDNKKLYNTQPPLPGEYGGTDDGFVHIISDADEGL